jgi:hypothetical protein
MEDEFVWVGDRFYGWIRTRIITPYPALAEFRKRYPTKIFFSTYAEATEWIFWEIIEKVDMDKLDKIQYPVQTTEKIRCSSALYDWLTQKVQREKTKDLYFHTYAEATEWIHDALLIHIENKEDILRFA